MTKQTRPQIGLVLGSGGPRGLAHIGVIKAFEEKGIPIDMITGTSVGAAVGGLYALTEDIDKIENFALEVDRSKFFKIFGRPSLFSDGLIKQGGIKKALEDNFGRKSFSDLKIPFQAVTTDINTGQRVDIGQGDLTKAILASLSVPLVFKPVEYKGRSLVDGGLTDPVPVDVAKEAGADKIFASNVIHYIIENKNRSQRSKNSKGKLRTAGTAFDIMSNRLAEYSVENADIILTPEIPEVNWFKFTDFQRVINSGKEEALSQLEKIKSSYLEKEK